MQEHVQEHVLDSIDAPGMQTRSGLRRNGFVFCDDRHQNGDKLSQLRATLPHRMDKWSVHASGLINVMHSAVCASSTDEEGQGVENTLWPKAGFWSSAGSEDANSAQESCVFRLAGPACTVRYLRMLVYRAFYQHGYPVYPPMELQIFTGPTLDQLQPASPRHTVHITAAPQIFPLYASAPLGRYLKVVFYGKHQCQFGDDKYYLALNWLSALGAVVPAPVLQHMRACLCSGTLQVSPAGHLPAPAMQPQQLTLREQQQGAVPRLPGGLEGQQRRWRAVQRHLQQRSMQDKLDHLQQLHQRVIGEGFGEEEEDQDEQQYHQLVVVLRRQIRELQRQLAAEQQRLHEQLQVAQGCSSCAVSEDLAGRLESAVEQFRQHYVTLRPYDGHPASPTAIGTRAHMQGLLKWRRWAFGSKQPQPQQQQQGPPPSTQAPLASSGTNLAAPVVTPPQPFQGVYMLQGDSASTSLTAAAAAAGTGAVEHLPAAVATAAAGAGAAVGLPGLQALLQQTLGVVSDLPDRPVLVPWVFAGQLQVLEVKLLAQELALSAMGSGEPAGVRSSTGAVAALQHQLQQQATQQAAEWQRWWQVEQGSLLLGWRQALQLLQQVMDACEQPPGDEALTEVFGKLPSSWAFQMLARQLLAMQPEEDSASSSSSGGGMGYGLTRLHHTGADWEALPAAVADVAHGPPSAAEAAGETAVVYQDAHTCITAGVQLQPGIQSPTLPLATYTHIPAGLERPAGWSLQLFQHMALPAAGLPPPHAAGGDQEEVYEEGVVADLLVQQWREHAGCPAA